MKRLANLALAALLITGTFGVIAQSYGNDAQPKTSYTYVASSAREPFHKPSCRWAQKISDRNLQTFKTHDEAIKAGHRPCKVCKP